MPTELTQVGIAGALVLLILDRVAQMVLPFVRRNGQNGNSHQAFMETHLQRQTDILTRLETLAASHHEVALKMSFQIDQTSSGIEKIRATEHAIVQQLQSWPTKCPLVVGGHVSITGERLP